MKTKGVTIWLFTGCLLIFLMVIIGGITRLTGSGLSIVEWNLISGTLPPLNEEEWNTAFEKYKQFPEYRKLNTGMDLTEFKFIFFWEYLHRLTGRLIGIVFFIPFLIFYLKKKLNLPLTKRLLVILALGALQGFMGWFMVKSGLADNPHVSHYRLAAHFLLACLLISLIFITALETIQTPRFPATKNIRRISLVIVSLIVIQLLYGAFTAGLKAGLAYNTFPDMNGEWIPAGIFMKESLTVNILKNGITVQFLHRLIGSTLVIFTLSACIYSYTAATHPGIKSNLTVLTLVIILQYLLGVLTLLHKVPLSLGVLHQGIAIIVLIVSVYNVYSMHTTQTHKA